MFFLKFPCLSHWRTLLSTSVPPLQNSLPSLQMIVQLPCHKWFGISKAQTINMKGYFISRSQCFTIEGFRGSGCWCLATALQSTHCVRDFAYFTAAMGSKPACNYQVATSQCGCSSTYKNTDIILQWEYTSVKCNTLMKVPSDWRGAAQTPTPT